MTDRTSCKWWQGEDDGRMFDTECNHTFEMQDEAGPYMEDYHFCPHCGFPIRLVAWNPKEGKSFDYGEPRVPVPFSEYRGWLESQRKKEVVNL